jgi:hypothetical protein
VYWFSPESLFTKTIAISPAAAVRPEGKESLE